MLFALNYTALFIYGLLIMVFLLGISNSKKNVISISAYAMICIILQLAFFFNFDNNFTEKAYPFIVHLPLLIFFCLFFKKPLNSVVFTLCTAYILTAPRRWIGDLIVIVFNVDEHVAVFSQIAISIPLLFVVYRYLRPYVNKILNYSGVKVHLLVVIPFTYYILAYATTVYTSLLYSSRVVLIGILTTGMASIFYYILIFYFNELTEKFTIQNEHNLLAVQICAMHDRAEAMKLEEENAIIFRHDLRHHLRLISSHLSAGNINAAQNYIDEIEKSVDASIPVKYCDNNAVNLILSSYINLAKNENITIKTQVYIPQNCAVADMDLCVILANAIENAINACANINESADRNISIRCNHKNHKLFIEVANSFAGEVLFKNELPVTEKENHGFGTKSIVTTVQKYKGVYSFSAINGIFKMNAIL